MSIEILKDQVEAILESGDGIQLHKLLDDQNISDVADLVDEMPTMTAKLLLRCQFIGQQVFLKFLTSAHKRISLKPCLLIKRPGCLTNYLLMTAQICLEELPSNVVRELIKLLDNEERKITLSLLVILRTVLEG
jgi:magnesium transporter